MRLKFVPPEDSDEHAMHESHKVLQALEAAGFETTVVTASGIHDIETPFIKVERP